MILGPRPHLRLCAGVSAAWLMIPSSCFSVHAQAAPDMQQPAKMDAVAVPARLGAPPILPSAPISAAITSPLCRRR